MHTLSSASRTCMASASAVECTATVAMPSSLHARSTRSAISPRLAMRILSNMRAGRDLEAANSEWRMANRKKNECGSSAIYYSPLATRHSLFRHSLFDDHQRLAELDGLAVLD